MPLVEIGDCYERQWPGEAKRHLWVTITQPIPELEGVAVTVSLTTERGISDMTTRLRAGDHPYIDRPTVVSYMDARLVPIKPLELAIAAKVLELRERFDMELVKEFQRGLMVSAETPKKVQTTYTLAVSMNLHLPE